MISVHQYARLCEDPILHHEKSVKRVMKCLIGRNHVEIEVTIDFNKAFVAFADSDLANGWNNLDADNIDNLLSLIGSIVCMFEIPITWCSRLQTRIALCSTEADHSALSMCIRDIAPIVNLEKELSSNFNLGSPRPMIKCKIFEDNESCIKIAKAPILTPKSKYAAIEHHYFRSHVENS